MSKYRKPLNKAVSAGKFRHSVGRTKLANLPRTVMRGGYRL